MQLVSAARSTWFNRFVLPGFAFKAVVIGGGYATGRELAEFFLPSGPRGGLLGMLLAMVIWSVVCAVTFLFARTAGSQDYRTFFQALLGPAWVLFDIAYLCFLCIVLSVFAAAAGAIANTTFGLPALSGTLTLIAGIAVVASFGTASVERLFKYITWFLYLVYAVFIGLMLTKYSHRIQYQFAAVGFAPGWAAGGVTYASYNIVGAVVILPVLRHLTSKRDAVIAGLLCGPLAMLPAILFFLGMIAFYPQIVRQPLPADFMLTQLGLPLLHVTFQIMIFCALLESGTGLVHAVNERIAAVRRQALPPRLRLVLSSALLLFSVFIAGHFGLITLIARGYRMLAYLLLAVFVAPLLTYGVWRILFPMAQPSPQEDIHARDPGNAPSRRRS